MSVRHILETKGREVVTVDAEATVGEAAAKLASRRIGATVVLGSRGEVVGILSERDIVRLIVAEGAEGLQASVGSRMTAAIVTGREDMTLEDAMGEMTRGRFRHLPICEGERLVGIISIGDAVKLRLEEAVQEAENMRSYIHAG